MAGARSRSDLSDEEDARVGHDTNTPAERSAKRTHARRTPDGRRKAVPHDARAVIRADVEKAVRWRSFGRHMGYPEDSVMRTIAARAPRAPAPVLPFHHFLLSARGLRDDLHIPCRPSRYPSTSTNENRSQGRSGNRKAPRTAFSTLRRTLLCRRIFPAAVFSPVRPPSAA